MSRVNQLQITRRYRVLKLQNQFVTTKSWTNNIYCVWSHTRNNFHTWQHLFKDMNYMCPYTFLNQLAAQCVLLFHTFRDTLFVLCGKSKAQIAVLELFFPLTSDLIRLRVQRGNALSGWYITLLITQYT